MIRPLTLLRRPRRKHGVATAAVASALLLGMTAPPAKAWATPWVTPIQPSNRGAPVPGGINGELPAGALTVVEGSCRLAPGAAPALTRLLADARAQAIDLGPEDCYRTNQGQIGARSNACTSGNCACAASGGAPTTGGTSIHGWGKAVDFSQGGGTVTFASSGYRWLKANASRYGFNHPGWAEPGGSSCPEAWHWEWVGDGGTLGTPSAVVGLARMPDGGGYWTANSYGIVRPFGTAGYDGWADVGLLAQPIAGLAVTATGRGYWLTATDGGIFSFGDAHFHGSLGATHLNAPIAAIAATPTGNGYWLTATDGGIFAFGDAHFHGSLGATHLRREIVAMAATPSGNGYWLTGADGGIFTFGDAQYQGSAVE